MGETLPRPTLVVIARMAIPLITIGMQEAGPSTRCARSADWLAHEEMNVLRHENVACDHESVSHARSIERMLDDMVCRCCAQQRLPMIATEGYKVKTSALLVANELCHRG